MKEFGINALSIRENDGYYMIRQLFIYDKFTTIKECYNQLYIWAHHYDETIMQYSIKQGQQVIEDKILISSLGIDIIPKDSHSTNQWLEKLRLDFIKELEKKLKEV